MAIWHLRSKVKPTGGRIKSFRKKRRMDRGTEFLPTKIDKRKAKIKNGRGKTIKIKLFSEEKINVADPKTKKVTPTKIISVEKNPANPHYVRRGIITKGCIVKTELGVVRVTSKPGKDGVLNGVLIKEK